MIGPSAAGAAAVLVALGLLGITGQLRAVTPRIFDPGALVRYGLPVARVLHDLCAAATLGTLVVAAFFVAPERGAGGGLGELQRALAMAARRFAVGWLAAAAAVLVLTAADLAAVRPFTPGFGSVLGSVLGQVDLGKALGVSALVVLVVINVVLVAARPLHLALAAGLAVLALLPLALAGHAAGTADHMNSVDSLALHLVGACLWVGGLIAVLLFSGRLGRQLPTVVGRYSTLAGVCFVLVAASGVVNALLRLGSPTAVTSGYGLLVLGKVAALGLLGVAGWRHRALSIPRLGVDGVGRTVFVRLAAVEVAVMGATMGLAVALSRSVPPDPGTTLDPVAVLLGHPVPAPWTLGRYLSAYYPSIVWLVVAGAMVGLYLAGLVRLRRRGDRWPVARTVFWLLGCAVLVFLTSGGPGVYGRLSFSLHMVQHMALMIIVPLLLVFGAPVTLALRALRARTDGSLGPREVLLAAVHSRLLRVLGHPIVATALFTGGLVAFYYTQLIDLAMFTHVGHVLMTAHFLLSGYLFVWALVGLDPGPERPPYPLRLVLLLMMLGFHAFFGISLMSSGQLLAPDWWHALGLTDDAALLADQQRGGAIAWGTGDIPSLLIGVALIISWVRSDTHEARRRDRKADRDGDADLRAYNEQLAALARQDDTP